MAGASRRDRPMTTEPLRRAIVALAAAALLFCHAIPHALALDTRPAAHAHAGHGAPAEGAAPGVHGLVVCCLWIAAPAVAPPSRPGPVAAPRPPSPPSRHSLARAPPTPPPRPA
jgi:hypothetical protein